MADAASILRQYGILIPEQMIQAAQAENVDLAVAATVLMGESGGGRNIYGHDTTNTAGTYTPGGPVTKANYLAYRAAMKAGRIPRNGVGPCQCTSAGYQDTADALGGAWDPVANMRSGFRGLGALVRTYGVQQGARRYNGSGPAAEAYGRAFVARYSVWKTRLAGASVPLPVPTGGDDMAAVPQAEWNAVRDALTALVKPWPGGVSDKEPSKLEDPNVAGYSLIQYALRNNVEIHRLRVELAELKASVAGLAARQV